MQGLQTCLQKTQPKILLLGVILYLISLVARAAAWRILLDRKATTWQAFIAMNEGYLINNFLPFRLGELGAHSYWAAKPGAVRIFHRIIIERYLIWPSHGVDHILTALALGLSWPNRWPSPH